jgi:hypothetical protein
MKGVGVGDMDSLALPPARGVIDMTVDAGDGSCSRNAQADASVRFGVFVLNIVVL